MNFNAHDGLLRLPISGVRSTIQRKMIVSSFGVRRRPGESAQQFNLHCGQIAAPHVEVPWSHVWCKRMQSWHEHMARHADLWPFRISAVQDAQWLQMRRLACGSQSLFAGQTRAVRAKVERRWHDGLEFSRSYLVNEHCFSN